MPYVQVEPENLVVGTEYALTRKGFESRTEGANTEVVNRPAYYGAPANQTKKVTVWKRPATVVAPPTAEKSLTDAYRALKTWESKDSVDAWKVSPSFLGKKRPSYTPVAPMDIRKKAFFAGVNDKGAFVFTQERSFGATKPVAFVPVDVNETVKASWGSMVPKYNNVVSPNDWAFWIESRNNVTRRNNSTTNAGLNRLAQMNALKAQHAPNSNAYKALEAEERNLIAKHLGGKKKRSDKKRSDKKRSNTKRNNRKNHTL